MISLEQWDKRIDKELGKENDTIGFYIMKVTGQLEVYHISGYFGDGNI